MTCISCHDPVKTLVDLGQQPPSNRFLKAKEDCERHPLIVGQCDSCGLVQLIKPMPDEMKASRYDWIRYDEPEGHLDELAVTLKDMGITSARSMSYKDESLVNRLGGEDRDASVVVGRHILEHKRDPVAFLESFKADTYVIEVPDCSRVLENNWYPFIWEEHIAYFTENSLMSFAAANGYTCEVLRYPMTFEDSLVAILRKGQSFSSVRIPSSFGMNFWKVYERIRNTLSYKDVAMVGAGHIGIKFANIFNVRIKFFSDDNEHKQGLFTPGSCIPIKPSSELKKPGLHAILSALAPESEAKFRKRHGLETTSIFPLFA